VLLAGLTAGVYLSNSAYAGRGHAHKLERAFTEAPIASRRLSRQKAGLRRGAGRTRLLHHPKLMSTMHNHERRAFTILELLVVIAVITILAALLLLC